MAYPPSPSFSLLESPLPRNESSSRSFTVRPAAVCRSCCVRVAIAIAHHTHPIFTLLRLPLDGLGVSRPCDDARPAAFPTRGRNRQRDSVIYVAYTLCTMCVLHHCSPAYVRDTHTCATGSTDDEHARARAGVRYVHKVCVCVCVYVSCYVCERVRVRVRVYGFISRAKSTALMFRVGRTTDGPALGLTTRRPSPPPSRRGRW